MPITSFTRSLVGKLITHSRLRQIISKLWLEYFAFRDYFPADNAERSSVAWRSLGEPVEMQHATSDGENSNTMCQPMVIMLVFSFHAEVTSTTGPGSK